MGKQSTRALDVGDLAVEMRAGVGRREPGNDPTTCDPASCATIAWCCAVDLPLSALIRSGP